MLQNLIDVNFHFNLIIQKYFINLLHFVNYFLKVVLNINYQICKLKNYENYIHIFNYIYYEYKILMLNILI